MTLVTLVLIVFKIGFIKLTSFLILKYEIKSRQFYIKKKIPFLFKKNKCKNKVID